MSYFVHCDRENCWGLQDIASDYYCAVNVKMEGYSLGRRIQKSLSDKTVVCAHRATMSLQLEIYANGCDATIDTAYSVLAELSSLLHNCDSQKQFYSNRILEQSTGQVTDPNFSEQKTRVVQLLQVEFDYVPCRPTLVFGSYKQEIDNGERRRF